MREPLPLATIHRAVLEFLKGRDDVALFGAHAVNACVDEPRMTQDVDVMSPRAFELAHEVQRHLQEKFRIAARVREISQGASYRVYQMRKPKNRHLVDVRAVESLPATQRIDGVLVVTPAELIAGKVIAMEGRIGQPKSGTDWRDIAMLLLAFPELKTEHGAVRDRRRR